MLANNFLGFTTSLSIDFYQETINRLTKSFSTIPTTKDWLQAIALLAVLALISLTVGFKFNFLEIRFLTASWKKIASIIAISLFTPAITEELFFRVLLLPHATEHVSAEMQWAWGSVSLIAFILYHPLNAASFFPAGQTTFKDPIFLLLAGVLGIACAIAYLQSGSLLLPVLIHWIVVLSWLLLLGGYKKLYA